MNKDIVFGIGIGLLIAAVIAAVSPSTPRSFTDIQIIKQARELGMIFPADLTVK